MANPTNPFLDFDVTPPRRRVPHARPRHRGDAGGPARNIEALTKANQLAAEGMQAVIKRQAEILRQTMEEPPA